MIQAALSMGAMVLLTGMACFRDETPSGEIISEDSEEAKLYAYICVNTNSGSFS